MRPVQRNIFIINPITHFIIFVFYFSLKPLNMICRFFLMLLNKFFYILNTQHISTHIQYN
nr:hypothetical protein C1892_13540 [Pseudomonas sp. MPBD7-1]